MGLAHASATWQGSYIVLCPSQGADSLVRSVRLVRLSPLAWCWGGAVKEEADGGPGGRWMSKRKEAWEAVGIGIGPFGIEIDSRGHAISHTQTEGSDRLQIRIDPAVTKETIKVRLVRPGL